ncbi:hypothetical protein [Marinobacter sp. F4218]|uniref:hypothetical protein n=1 Tax=Marinobacter sp. F4218 TaxID=2862868 RepID=UPI002B45DBC7|nr:hypothetical protein [Marinobacter sp. F4218]
MRTGAGPSLRSDINKDLFAWSAITPGDKEHRATTTKKVTPDIATLVDALYLSLTIAGTKKAESIQKAEAAEVLENTQRDLNIVLINELAIPDRKSQANSTGLNIFKLCEFK